MVVLTPLLILRKFIFIRRLQHFLMRRIVFLHRRFNLLTTPSEPIIGTGILVMEQRQKKKAPLMIMLAREFIPLR